VGHKKRKGFKSLDLSLFSLYLFDILSGKKLYNRIYVLKKHSWLLKNMFQEFKKQHLDLKKVIGFFNELGLLIEKCVQLFQ
jgi:hypothetical protein